MTKESIERALTTSLHLMLGLATLDLALFIWVGTSVVTVVAHAMSLWLFLRYRLIFDLVKLLETSALIIDLYLINMYGYAVASPVATLLAIIHISLNKDYHLGKLKHDLDKVLASKQKDVENDKT
ncbi:MAG: hypothetical protein H8E67_06625 [Proteobacteria bacterium]|jgi:hypothetical protein|nr:hypothetical protein [Pseudomonadota bacterium]MBT5794389.1 hypothetical protein [Deltaproteobacteria bacterium]